MKFAFIITNLAGGGAEKVVLTLAAGLVKRGHDVIVILLENCVVHAVPEGVKVLPLTENAPRGWLGKRVLAHRLKRHLYEPLDLVVSALPFANEVAILAKAPRLWCRIDNTLGTEIEKLQATNPAKAKRRLGRYRRLFGDRRLIAISDGMIEDLRIRISAKGRIEKIPNPIDLDAIRRAATVPTLDLPSGPYVIHVGRFNTQKRHDLLLDAWGKLDTSLELILLTPYDPTLQSMIDDRGLSNRVRIAGFKKNPFPWIAGAELLVLCSDHEGLPGVLIEALACGTRVVSTDCPSGPKEILCGDLERGLVPCGDSDALARTIRKVLMDPKPNDSMIELALAPFGIEQTLDAWESLAHESINNNDTR